MPVPIRITEAIPAAIMVNISVAISVAIPAAIPAAIMAAITERRDVRMALFGRNRQRSRDSRQRNGHCIV
jgi:hypothetical protein